MRPNFNVFAAHWAWARIRSARRPGENRRKHSIVGAREPIPVARRERLNNAAYHSLNAAARPSKIARGAQNLFETPLRA